MNTKNNKVDYKIPVYKPLLDGNEKNYVNECLDSNWISSRGEFIEKFENAICKFTGAKYATAVTNGTGALHLALVTLGIGVGDEVIVPSFTYIASVSSIVYTGAKPVFVDSLEKTWQMNPDDVRKKISSRTKAIMAVHLYGHPCEMKELMNISRENNLFLIEDCAEALGSEYNGKYAGAFGDISAFSFYGNKIVTTGEGGMLLTNDSSIYNKAYHLKMHGLTKGREYWHDVIGYNYRMSNISAAIGLAQLETIAKRIKMKRDLVKWYRDSLKGLPLKFQEEDKNVFSTYWMFNILAENSENRQKLRECLRNNSIETRPAFTPVHMMPMFSQASEKLPVAENLGNCGISLPSYPSLSREEVKYICEIIISFYKLSN